VCVCLPTQFCAPGRKDTPRHWPDCDYALLPDILLPACALLTPRPGARARSLLLQPVAWVAVAAVRPPELAPPSASRRLFNPFLYTARLRRRRANKNVVHEHLYAERGVPLELEVAEGDPVHAMVECSQGRRGCRDSFSLLSPTLLSWACCPCNGLHDSHLKTVHAVEVLRTHSRSSPTEHVSFSL